MKLWHRLTKRAAAETPYVPDQCTIRREVEIERVAYKAQTVFEVWPAPDGSAWTADQVVHATDGLVTRGYVNDLFRGHSEDEKLTKWICSCVVGYPTGPLSSRYDMSVWDRPMWWWRMVRARHKTFPDPSKLREMYTRAYVAGGDLRGLIERPARKARLLYPTVPASNETPEWYTVETLHPVWACAILQITPLDLGWLVPNPWNPNPEITPVGNSSGQLQPDTVPNSQAPEGFLLRYGNITRAHGSLDPHKAYDRREPQLLDELIQALDQDVLQFRVKRADVVKLMTPPGVEIDQEVTSRAEAVGLSISDDPTQRYTRILHKDGET